VNDGGTKVGADGFRLGEGGFSPCGDALNELPLAGGGMAGGSSFEGKAAWRAAPAVTGAIARARATVKTTDSLAVADSSFTSMVLCVPSHLNSSLDAAGQSSPP
jgi:hypothetical protein